MNPKRSKINNRRPKERIHAKIRGQTDQKQTEKWNLNPYLNHTQALNTGLKTQAYMYMYYTAPYCYLEYSFRGYVAFF